MFPSDSGGKKQARLPFTPGIPDLSAFPTGVIKRLYNKFWSRSAAKDLVYDHSVGSPKLRAAISQFLNNYRGLPCSDDQIVITNGTQSSLLTAACVLADPGDGAIIENPGHLVLQNALRMAGLRLVPWDVDREGIKPDSGRVNGADGYEAPVLFPDQPFPSRRNHVLKSSQESCWIGLVEEGFVFSRTTMITSFASQACSNHRSSSWTMVPVTSSTQVRSASSSHRGYALGIL